MKKPYFPVYTQVSQKPVAICEKLPAEVFDYPFFNDAVPIVRPMNSKRKELPLDVAPDFPNPEVLKLKGFIFHTSHCGSTLLANMLGASKKTRVISETEAINGLLLSAIFYKLGDDEILKGIKTLISSYLQPLGEAENVIFKLTSWNVFFIEFFQKAYPDVPWIYIDRKKEAVVQSLLKSGRGFVEWWQHPTDLLRKYFLGENTKPATFEEYLFNMVENHRKFSEKGNPQNKLQLGYPNFINEFENRILPHFNLEYSEEELKSAKEEIHFDAKSFQKTPFRQNENAIENF